MPTLTLDIDITAQPERVFAGLLDAPGYANWLTIHDGWPQGAPLLEPGGSFVQDVSLMGRSAQVSWTVVELRAPSLICLDGVGPSELRMRSRYRIEESEAGSTLRYESEFHGGPVPLDGRIGSMVLKRARSTGEESLAKFAAMIEAGDHVSAAHEHPTGRRATAQRVGAGRTAGTRQRVRLPMLRWASNARLVAAIEENTRAIEALREELARGDKPISASAWLSAPFDLLRRGTTREAGDAGVRADDEPPANATG